jgi:hypothetical protein
MICRLVTLPAFLDMGCGASKHTEVPPTVGQGATLSEAVSHSEGTGRKQIFLSYRKKECGPPPGDGTAARIKALLMEEGWTVFLDEVGLEGGSKW